MGEIKTRYPGVYYSEISRTGYPNQKEKSYVVRWRDPKTGKSRAEYIGRQFRDNIVNDMAAARIRGELIEGKRLGKKELSQKKKEEKHAYENRWTLNKIWERYLEYNPNLRGVTTDINRFSKHIKPLFGHLAPEEVDESEVNELKDFLLGLRNSNKFSTWYFKKYPNKSPDSFKGYSKGYTNLIIESIRRTANWGADNIKVNGKYIKGLLFKVKLIKNVNNEKTGYLSIEQRGALIKAAKEYPYKPIGNLIIFLFSTGCRKGETFRLQWKDIKWDEGTIELLETKSGTKQYIPLTDLLRGLLNNLPRIEDSSYIFPGKNGNIRVEMSRSAKTIFKNAGLPEDFRIHDLRHAYTCALAESGISMEVISRLLRHHSITITEKRYARFSPKYIGKEAEVIGKIFEEATGEIEKGKVLPFPKKS